MCLPKILWSFAHLLHQGAFIKRGFKWCSSIYVTGKAWFFFNQVPKASEVRNLLRNLMSRSLKPTHLEHLASQIKKVLPKNSTTFSEPPPTPPSPKKKSMARVVILPCVVPPWLLPYHHGYRLGYLERTWETGGKSHEVLAKIQLGCLVSRCPMACGIRRRNVIEKHGLLLATFSLPICGCFVENPWMRKARCSPG